MRLQHALIAAGLLALAGAAWSQTVTLEPEAAQRCLTGPGEPEYPFEAWKTQVRGTVEVQLRFDSPDQPPVASSRPIYSVRSTCPIATPNCGRNGKLST